MKKENKYLYSWKIYINYGEGWEYECFNDKWREHKSDVNAYRKNCNYPMRITKGRETNPYYKEGAK